MLDTITNFLIYNYDKLTRITFIALGAIIAAIIVELAFRSWIKHAPTKRAQTLLSVIVNIIKAVIFIIAALAALTALHVNITPFLASAGILGLAIGFGSQLLIRDIITGIFLIFENQFNAGDTITVDSVTGVVEHVGLRTISVRDRQTGALHIIPNGAVAKLANLSNHYSRINVPITVSVKNDVDKVKTVLEETAKEVQSKQEYEGLFLNDIKVFALDDLDPEKMTFKVVIKTQPNQQEGIAQEYRYLLKKNFDKANIILA